MPIDRVAQFLIDAGLEPGEKSVPSPPPVVVTATAPEIVSPDERPYGIHRIAAPPGMIAIQALDANGEEFALYRVRATAFKDSAYAKMAMLLATHCPGGELHLKLLKD